MKERYRRMLEGMSGEEGALEWGVYVLRCGDGTLYTGIAKDVASRVRRHNEGKGAAYTRSRRPVELLHQQGPFTRSQALIREAWIKRLPRARKEKILAQPLDARSFRVYSHSKKRRKGSDASEEAHAEAKARKSQGR